MTLINNNKVHATMKVSNKKEVWKDVVGFGKGYYEVSNFGQVRTIARKVRIGHGGFRRVAPSIKMQSGKEGEKLSVCLSVKGVVNGRTVERLVASAFLDVPKRGKYKVTHKDGDQSNNHASNLEVTRIPSPKKVS